jgi:hypothetical protein
MTFIKIEPNRNRISSSHAQKIIRASFSYFKREDKNTSGYNLILYIGKELAEKFNLRAGDKISFSYDNENKRKWLIHKSDIGYTLGTVSGNNSPAYRIILKWPVSKIFKPEEKDMKLRELKHEAYDGGILIDAF